MISFGLGILFSRIMRIQRKITSYDIKFKKKNPEVSHSNNAVLGNSKFKVGRVVFEYIVNNDSQ